MAAALAWSLHAWISQYYYTYLKHFHSELLWLYPSHANSDIKLQKNIPTDGVGKNDISVCILCVKPGAYEPLKAFSGS